MKRRPRVVFFDVDGVLLDSLAMHLKICEDLSRENCLGLKIPTPDEFKKLARTGVRISPMKSFFRALGFSEPDAERANRYYEAHFMEKYPAAPFPFVEDVLRNLDGAGMALGIVTSNIRANVQKALGRSWGFFDPRLLYTYDHIEGLTKAQALTAGVRQLGIAPEDAIFVGDQITDRDAAAEAGVHFLGVTYGWGISREDKEFDTVHDPRELAVYLLNGQEHS